MCHCAVVGYALPGNGDHVPDSRALTGIVVNELCPRAVIDTTSLANYKKSVAREFVGGICHLNRCAADRRPKTVSSVRRVRPIVFAGQPLVTPGELSVGWRKRGSLGACPGFAVSPLRLALSTVPVAARSVVSGVPAWLAVSSNWRSAKARIKADRCVGSRRRRRHESLMPSSSMTFLDCILSIPGIDARRSRSLISPMAASAWPIAMMSARDALPRLTRSFTRALLARPYSFRGSGGTFLRG